MLNADDALAVPTRIAVVGGHLIVLDPAADSMVKEIDRDDGRMVRQFGRHGQGPGEFEGPWSIDPVPGSSSRFWVYDLMLDRSTLVDLDADFDGRRRLGDRILPLRGTATLLDPIRVAGNIVSLGLLQRGRLAILDGRGTLLRTTGPTPLPQLPDIPVSVRQHAYQSRMEPNPSRTRLALATRHADRIDIYRADGTPLAAAQRLFRFEPAFEVGERNGRAAFATGGDLRFGYVDLATTERRIYALFSGRTRAGFPGKAYYGRFVHVFDWDGRLVRVLELDAPAIAVAVDTAGRTLYTVRHDPKPAILAYDLDSLAIR